MLSRDPGRDLIPAWQGIKMEVEGYLEVPWETAWQWRWAGSLGIQSGENEQLECKDRPGEWKSMSISCDLPTESWTAGWGFEHLNRDCRLPVTMLSSQEVVHMLWDDNNCKNIATYWKSLGGGILTHASSVNCRIRSEAPFRQVLFFTLFSRWPRQVVHRPAQVSWKRGRAESLP